MKYISKGELISALFGLVVIVGCIVFLGWPIVLHQLQVVMQYWGW